MQKLRHELTIPTGLDTAQRVVALENAFQPRKLFGTDEDSALMHLAECDEVDFFGCSTLVKAFGADLRNAGSRPWKLAQGQEWMAGLRRRAYRYVVVGFERHIRYRQTKQLAVTLALRLNSRLIYGEATHRLDGAVETMKLRAGLMNKVQAQLLADHLNQLATDSELRWQVLEGPAPDASARAWLDAVGPAAPVLRRESGEAAAWNLGPVAERAIATFRLENGFEVSRSQVFSLQSPRVILPPRFILSCQLSPGFNLPADGTAGIAARRGEPSKEARKLCELISDTNLQSEDPWPELVTFHVGFTDGVRDFICDEGKHYLDEPAEAYLFGFDRHEAELAVKHLTGSEYGNFVAVRMGEGGDFNPLQCSDRAREAPMTDVDGLPCGIEVFCYRG